MICAHCNNTFDITGQDQTFYQTMQVPAPTLCPDCRQQRRLAWRNERNLYWRTCDGTGKQILSVFSKDKPFTVYDVDYWYTDKWDPFSYGRDFDFSRPFFPQFAELMQVVPQLARSVVNVQNCDYVNQCGWSKNCYLIFEADFDENCMYSGHLTDSKSSVDMLYSTKCELCYECVDCQGGYNLKFSQDSENCSDSWFLKNCIGCRDSFGCVNLRHKQYCIFNEQYTKEEYEKKLKEYRLDTTEGINAFKPQFLAFGQQFPHKYMHGVNNEEVSGDYISNSKNCVSCFDVHNSRDCKFVSDSRNVRNTYDMTVFGSQKGVDYCYENHEIGDGVRNVMFSDQIWAGVNNVQYSKLCTSASHDLFGCIGMKKASYCILNKQYSKEEYEELRDRIISHMKETGEYGEFFPMSMSPFAYNETLAQEYYPMTQETAHIWREPEQPVSAEGHDISICMSCSKSYRIVAQELSFYKQMNLPAPEECFDCRHRARMALRNPRKLLQRTCAICNTALQTTYDSSRPEPLYCEKCYLEALY